jgi:hypothetical protein
LEVTLGALPVARRDVERLRQIFDLHARLTGDPLSPRAKRTLTQRSAFADTLTWMEIHSDTPEAAEQIRVDAAQTLETEDDGPRPKRRRRRRRRRGPRKGGGTSEQGGSGEPGNSA